MTSVSAWIFVAQRPRDRLIACTERSFCAKFNVLDFDASAVDRGASCHHARVDPRSEQFRPKPPLRPAVEAIIDRRRRTVVHRQPTFST